MDLSLTIRKTCSWCGLKYPMRKNVSYKHRDFCSMLHKDQYIEAQSSMNGASIDIASSNDDNPSRDLFDWAYMNSMV